MINIQATVITGTAALLQWPFKNLQTNGNSDHCRIATPQNFIRKSGTHDYARDITPRETFGANQLGGGSPQTREI